MAKFSQAFLQSLTQPAYQEGLFTAAQGIGMAPVLRLEQERQKEEAEKFSSLDTAGQLDFAITKANESGDYSAAAKLAATRDKYILDMAKKQADAKLVKDKGIVDLVSNILFKANQNEVPDTITGANGEEVPIPLDLRDDIAKKLNEMYDTSNALASASSKGELEPEVLNVLQQRVDDLDPSVKADLRRWNSLKDKPVSGEKRRLATRLTKVADSLAQKTRQAQDSKEGLELQVDAIIRQINDIGSFTNWGFGKDVAEFLMDFDSDSDEYQQFRSNMAQALKEGVSENDLEAIIARSIVGLEDEIDAEDKGRRGRQLDRFQLREAVIEDLIAKGMSPQDAEDTVRQAEENR